MYDYDYLVIDIGSTYTKQRLFKNYKLMGSVQSPTTVDNVYRGIKTGREKMKELLKVDEIKSEHVLSSSSAAGGLRMIAMGYMGRVTAKAAKEVAMNSGAKILEILSNEDPPEYRIEVLREINPDIILLAGGTDFGDEVSITENASLIVKSEIKAVVIIAGNLVAQPRVAKILKENSIPHIRVQNIMPTIHQLRVDEARETIHREFINQIIKSQGVSILKEEITNDKIIPTPGAVLMASELLAKGTYLEKGIGDLIVIDLGGATTDIHSIMPSHENLGDEEIGLIVSNEKQVSYRTVEGNLGMRLSAMSMLDAVNPKFILNKKGIKEEDFLEKFISYCKYIGDSPEHIAENDEERMFDKLLAETAVEVALKRHAGYIATEYDPITGITPGMPIGRDLRNVDTILCVGGVFANRDLQETKSIVINAIKDKGPSLLPNNPDIIIDENYLLFTEGIISQIDEEYAFQALKIQFKI